MAVNGASTGVPWAAELAAPKRVTPGIRPALCPESMASNSSRGWSACLMNVLQQATATECAKVSSFELKNCESPFKQFTRAPHLSDHPVSQLGVVTVYAKANGSLVLTKILNRISGRWLTCALARAWALTSHIGNHVTYGNNTIV